MSFIALKFTSQSTSREQLFRMAYNRGWPIFRRSLGLYQERVNAPRWRLRLTVGRSSFSIILNGNGIADSTSVTPGHRTPYSKLMARDTLSRRWVVPGEDHWLRPSPPEASFAQYRYKLIPRQFLMAKIRVVPGNRCDTAQVRLLFGNLNCPILCVWFKHKSPREAMPSRKVPHDLLVVRRRR